MSFICIQSAAAAAAALCVVLLLLLLQLQLLLLLAAAVRHRVPDGKYCCWFINSDSSVFFLLIQNYYCLYTPCQYCCIYGLDFLTCSVISRGAKESVSPPRRSPPCTWYFLPKTRGRHSLVRIRSRYLLGGRRES